MYQFICMNKSISALLFLYLFTLLMIYCDSRHVKSKSK